MNDDLIRPLKGLAWNASIVVPAHNEADRGFAAAPLLSAAVRELGYLVVVVCNGCTDTTSSMAHDIPGATVVDVPEAGKSNALNLGDRAAGDVFPRVYLDADVHMDVSSLRNLVDVLRTDEPAAAGPTVNFLTENCSWMVRSYYDAISTIPFWVEYRAEHLEGRGVYATNQSGRARFTTFPPIRADDAFFDRMFDSDQKHFSSSSIAGVPVPERLREFLRAQKRSVAGAYEFHEWMDQNQPERRIVSNFHVDPHNWIGSRVLQHMQRGGVPGWWRPRVLGMLVGYLSVELLSRTSVLFGRIFRRDAVWR